MLKKAVTSLLVFMVLVQALLTGCEFGGGSRISFVMAEKIKSLDPALSKSKDDAALVLHVFEGLTRVGQDGRTAPGTAISWVKSADGLKYTFYINTDARWSDGKPVTARDFEYAWKRALNPKVASENVYQLYYIKNAKGYNMSEDPEYKGVKASMDEVGVKALDTETLEVTLETPCTYWIDLTNMPVYMPVRQDIIEEHAQDWHTDTSTYIGNGAYRLKSLKTGEVTTALLQKSRRYWDADSVENSSVELILAEGNYSREYENFNLGKTDGAAGIPVPASEIMRLKAEGQLVVADLMTSYYLSFRTNKKPFDSPEVRKAFTIALNRAEIVRAAARGVEKPAAGIVPYKIPGADPLKDFRTDALEYTYLYPEADAAKAKRLLEEAGYTDISKFPEVVLIYEDTGTNRSIMQTIQAQWQKNLGINVILTAYDANGFKSKKVDGVFNIAAEAWTGEYNDPQAFLKMWTSYSIFNVTGLRSEQYDSYLIQAMESEDNIVRMGILHSAETLLMEIMPVCPLYFDAEPLLMQNGLKNIVTSPYGYLYFHYADKE